MLAGNTEKHIVVIFSPKQKWSWAAVFHQCCWQMCRPVVGDTFTVSNTTLFFPSLTVKKNRVRSELLPMLSHHPLDFCHWSARWIMMEKLGLSDWKAQIWKSVSLCTSQHNRGGWDIKNKRTKKKCLDSCRHALYQSGVVLCGGGASWKQSTYHTNVTEKTIENEE